MINEIREIINSLQVMLENENKLAKKYLDSGKERIYKMHVDTAENIEGQLREYRKELNKLQK
jgi:hypothetical protein